MLDEGVWAEVKAGMNIWVILERGAQGVQASVHNKRRLVALRWWMLMNRGKTARRTTQRRSTPRRQPGNPL
jgi:hypothetical protein